MTDPKHQRWVSRARRLFRDQPDGLRLFLQQDTGSLSAHVVVGGEILESAELSERTIENGIWGPDMAFAQ